MQSIQKSILLFILVVPFVEIYLLLEVGGLIGMLPTILLVVLTAGIGANLVRQQGFSTWQRLQVNLAQGVMPAYELVEGLLILVGGLLLLLPGFFTDILGLICLMPGLRKRIAHAVLERRLFSAFRPGNPFKTSGAQERDVLEGEFSRDKHSE